MSVRRWMRLLFGRSQLMLLAGVAFLVVVVIVFADLTMSKSAAVASYQRAKAKVEQLDTQNARLHRDLERAQKDQQVMIEGWNYFGRTPKGVRIVVGEPEATAPAAAVEESPAQPAPFWVEWRQRLGLP
jgi:anti-sigma-K factor RskA